MKKSSPFKLIILILALIFNSMLIKSMHQDQLVINTDRATQSKMPIASFHKFWADIQWMLMIQHMGSMDMITEKSSLELAEEANHIIDLDPGFYKVYEISALMLSSSQPDLSIDILRRGQNGFQTKNRWKLYSLAGNIRQQEIFFKPKENNMDKLREVIGFYREALTKPGVISILERTYIKTLAHVRTGNRRSENYVAELEEWDKHLAQKNHNHDFDGGQYNGMYDSIPEDTKKELLSLVQKIKQYEPDDLKGKVISKKIITSLFKNLHVCKKCYHQYTRGDKFCSHCSRALRVFGVCKSSGCGKVIRGGRFCEHCGTRVNSKK